MLLCSCLNPTLPRSLYPSKSEQQLGIECGADQRSERASENTTPAQNHQGDCAAKREAMCVVLLMMLLLCVRRAP
eukprot:6186662-Pleurochrysis_carterae.AAC.1